MSPTTRRSFLKTGLAAGAVATVGTLPLAAAKRTATDSVVLGRSNLNVTRLAFGTGTDGGAVQAGLGQKHLRRLPTNSPTSSSSATAWATTRAIMSS